jgi:dCMP deaminase
VRPTWEEYFLNQLVSLAQRATCDRGRCAAIFTRDNDILTSGYVGAPPGQPHCDDVGHLWDPTGRRCVRTLHAEQNALIRAARNGVNVRDATVYCTMEPCEVCAMMMIGIGVKKFVAAHPYHAGTRSREMLYDAGIKLVTVNTEELYRP